MGIPSNYYDILARIESSNNPYAKATSSSASGLYQFIKDTWIGLGGRWGSNPNLPFGGLRPSVEEQNQRVQTLTNRNASALERVGVAVNNATLYAAHFLGIGGAKRILAADPNTPIEAVTTASQRRANPSILQGTVGDFFAWLQRKTGSAVSFQNSGAGGASNTTGNSFLDSLIAAPGPNPLRGMMGFGNAVGDAGEAVIDTVTGPFDWIKETFTMRNGSRLISIILGIALVIVAIVVLANSSDSLKLEAPSPVGA
jgi:hypothetical protein